MSYKFIKFNGIAPRGDTKIGINKSGLIRLSSGFCRITNARSFDYTILFYDSVNRAMAFRFTNKKEDGVLTVTKDGTAATVSGKSFFTANNLDLQSFSGRYDWTKMVHPDIGEIYIIDLPKNETTS